MIHVPQRNIGDFGLKIIKNGFSYNLPVNWSIKGDGDINTRLEANERAYSHGATVGGDKKIKSRTIDISILVKGSTQQEYDKAINEVYRQFLQNDYTLLCGRTDRQYNVAGCQKTSGQYIKGYKQRRSEITLTLLLADPFKSAVQQSEYRATFSGAVENYVFEVVNEGSADALLKITLVPDAAMTDVIIYHQETQKQLRIRDTFLTNPATLVIDTKGGTVLRGTDNAINNMSGQFLVALPGMNHYSITSAAGQIKMQYYARWLV